MKRIVYLILVFGLTLASCNQTTQSTPVSENQIGNSEYTNEIPSLEKPADKVEIQNLIRELLKWADSKKSIDLLPVLTDKDDSLYIGFDLDQLKLNLDKLKEINLFSKEFIENYNQIILTLDSKLKANEFEYGTWIVGDMPPFNFVSGVNPWCLCQDNMDWDLVEVEQVKENNYRWKWGGLNQNTHQSWKDFTYKFNVIKENSKWKISYLEGFNISEIMK